jgi:hypothetical protein
MNIAGKITEINYKVTLAKELKIIDLKEFDINDIPTSCIINNGTYTFALSKWLAPKRSRSYPYERVYNTLNSSERISVIPLIKDEGAIGDMDFLQWDSVSLMSLLDVFVIIAYYNKATKKTTDKGNKITNQQFDNDYILKKIKDIEANHSSALHWNLNELNRISIIL